MRYGQSVLRPLIQLSQSFIVAVSSGVIATTLFFMATDLARNDQGKLAAVEATQSTELIFAMIGEMILIGIALPGPISLVGIVVIIIGMGLHSFQTALGHKEKTARHLLRSHGLFLCNRLSQA